MLRKQLGVEHLLRRDHIGPRSGEGSEVSVEVLCGYALALFHQRLPQLRPAHLVATLPIRQAVADGVEGGADEGLVQGQGGAVVQIQPDDLALVRTWQHGR